MFQSILRELSEILWMPKCRTTKSEWDNRITIQYFPEYQRVEHGATRLWPEHAKCIIIEQAGIEPFTSSGPRKCHSKRIAAPFFLTGGYTDISGWNRGKADEDGELINPDHIWSRGQSRMMNMVDCRDVTVMTKLRRGQPASVCCMESPTHTICCTHTSLAPPRLFPLFYQTDFPLKLAVFFHRKSHSDESFQILNGFIWNN